MAWQCVLLEVTVQRFKNAVYQVQWMGLMMICFGMRVKRMGMLGVWVRKLKALTVKVETLTQIGKGR